MRQTRDRRLLIVGVGTICALTLFVVARFEVTTDISTFLPESEREDLRLSRQLVTSELSRTMILTIAGKSEVEVARASRIFESALRAAPDVEARLAFLEGGPPKGIEEAIWTIYHSRRIAFFASSAAEVRRKLTTDALRAAAKRLKSELEQPTSVLVGRVAPADPLLVSLELFARFERSRAGGIQIHDGRFVTEDGAHAILFLGTKASAFDSTEQKPLLGAIDRVFASVNERFGHELQLERSGVNRFSVSAESAIKADIQRVTIFTALGIAILLIVLFGSLRLVALGSLPLLAGMVGGCAATLAIFGRLHGITLAFGASLLGVAIDYVVHLYCHHSVQKHTNPRRSLQTIWWALLTGAATTTVGFMALSASPFRGLREVAVFAIAGMVATVAATYLMLPALMPSQVRRGRARAQLIAWLGNLLARMQTRERRWILWLPVVGALIFATVFLPRVEWNPSFADLGSLDRELLAEEERVRGRVDHAENMHMVVAVGDNEQAALETNDGVADALEQATRAGQLGSYRSLATFLPSAKRQSEVAAAVRDDTTLRARLFSAFADEGFVAEKFSPFFSELQGTQLEPLRFSHLMNSPLGPMVRRFRVELAGKIALVTLLTDVRNTDELERRIADIDGAAYINQEQQIARANHSYQRHTFILLCIGFGAVVLVLGARYRRVAPTLAAALPALLGAAVAISALVVVGRRLDLVALTSVLMIISMGVDYGVFLVDASLNESSEDLPAAMLSILVAAGSTLLGFSLLGLSAHPALASIGITAAAGIAACVILAPVSLALIHPDRGQRNSPQP